MEKKYYFLSGLPRSGNTLLSAILNQNPDIYSTPLSPVSTFLWEFENIAKNQESLVRNNENKTRTEKFLYSFLDNFYKDVDSPIIIEREKAWGTPYNLNIIKKNFSDAPKIIFTVRDILEILASFVKINSDNLYREANEIGLYISNYRSKKDIICEYLMSLNNDIDKGLLALSSAFYPENKGIFHIVEYNDLVLKPEETISNIYDFLEIPKYEHDFKKIKKLENDNDDLLGIPKHFHDVRSSISKSLTDIDILSDYIKNKYSNMEFWREGSAMKVRGKDF